jgi:hypothetical protein
MPVSFAAAPHPPQQLIPNQGGPILQAPSVITVTWSGDPLATQLQAFDAWLIGSNLGSAHC